MNRAVLFALGCWWLVMAPATAQDKPAAPPQEAFLGEWVNADKDTRGIKRIEVTRKDDAWTIEAWGSSGAGEIGWGKVKLSLLGEDVRSKDLPFGFASWETKLGTHHLSLKVEKDELVVEVFRIFTNDPMDRSNFRKVEKFKKK